MSGQDSAGSNNSDNVSDDMWAPTSEDFVPRYTGPSESDLSDEQRQLREEIIAKRPRTGWRGPFGPWLAVPSIAQPAQQLGQAVRYGTHLSFRESELAILLTGAKMRSHTEFDLHVGEAQRAGWTLDVIRRIPRDGDFSQASVASNLLPVLDNPRERAIARFVAELLETHTVSDSTYEETKAALDGKDSLLMEITSIVGYYMYVCYTLNVFRIPSK
jgi:4-carboxymuconolactone decarboxylase